MAPLDRVEPQPNPEDGFRRLDRGFGFLISGKVRVFDFANYHAAEAWITNPV